MCQCTAVWLAFITLQPAATHLALLMMLQQILAAGASWVWALLVVAAEYVRPQLLAHSAAASKLALFLALLALGTVPQKQQPPLLLLYVLLPVFQAFLRLLHVLPAWLQPIPCTQATCGPPPQHRF